MDKNLLNEQVKKIKPSKLLKDYCPWLANFSANKLNIDLEIPGQYDGQKLPLPQHHIKISGFHPEVCKSNLLNEKFIVELNILLFFKCKI